MNTAVEETQITIPESIGDAGVGTTNQINVGGNTVTRCTEHLPERDRAAVRWLHHYARGQQWSWDELAKAVGFSTTVIYRIWTDKYRYPAGSNKAGDRIPIDKQVTAILRLKRISDERDAVHSSGFVENSVWKRIDWLCNRAFIRQKIGFIYGESQIGKTTGLIEHARRNNHGQTSYVEIPPGAGLQLMMRHIARALFVNSSTCYEKLIDDVAAALDPSKLLLIDQVHRIFVTYNKRSIMKCLDALMYLHDVSKCGMVLCGTHIFRDQLRFGEFAQFLKQLRRRGLYELQLPAVPIRDDLDLMAEQFGLEPADGDAEPIVLQIARDWGFGQYVTRLTDAAELASKKKEKLNWGHFVRASQIVDNMAKEVK